MNPAIGLSPGEIAVLRGLGERKKTPKELAAELGVSPPLLSRHLRSLKEKGLVFMERAGLRKMVWISDTRHASLFRRILSDFGHMELERQITSSAFEILSCLAFSGTMRRSEIAAAASVSPRTVQSVLQRFREVGILRRDPPGTFGISDRFSPLAEFAVEFRRYSNLKLATALYPDAVVVWEKDKEFIIKTSNANELDGFRLTAFSAYHRFGVQLFLVRHYQFHSPERRKLRAEDVLIHTLLLGPLGTRDMTALLLLWKRTEGGLRLHRLMAKAKEYGVADEISKVQEYLYSAGARRPSNFPMWTEFTSKAREYGL